MKTLLSLSLLILCSVSYGQMTGVPFGKVTMTDLSMKKYPKDTTAVAVVLDEVGTAMIGDKQNEYLVFEKYVKIKIFSKEGFAAANFIIPMHKEKNYSEAVMSVEGTTYNFVNGAIQETKLENKNVFRSTLNILTDVTKFTMPNIQEGSVIEVRYRFHTPFYYNEFKTWQFQSEIPKVHSQYMTLIPGNYVYNATLKGPKKLSKNESSIVKNCFGSRESECVQSIYAMDDIEPFVEEEFMTARENFESAIVFELAQVMHSDGRPQKISKEWRDVELDLQQHSEFGVQIKRAKSLYADKIVGITSATDTLTKAKAIYDYVRKWYTPIDIIGIYTGDGVKISYDKKSGSAGDINLSLVGALQAAGIQAFPVILSTRDNGVPSQLHPVISGFNYVIAAVFIGGKSYLLDAYSQSYPFGMIPKYCMNGKGRLLSKNSSWIDLAPSAKAKSNVNVDITLNNTGIEGAVSTSYSGYDAVSVRQGIKSAGQLDDYLASLEKQWKDVELDHYEVISLDSSEVPLKEKMTIKKELELQKGMVYFNPFLDLRWNENPFKASSRTFPVDFAIPFDEVYMMNITYPPDYVVEETPTPAAINLAKGGGKLFFNVSELGNKITLTFSLAINRPIFDPAEYTALKDFFARVALIKQSQIVFKKKA